MFVVYMTEEFVNTNLEELDLSVRSYNCLRRAGFRTIGDVLDKISTQDELLRYNKLGSNSAKEIMRKIFEYHYNHLPEDKVQEYEKRLAQLNNSA